MSWTRGWYKAGSALLLIGAGVHLSAHWQAYVAIDVDDPVRRAAIEAMRGYVVNERFGITLWTALGAFSLAFGALLAVLGTTHWILVRECEPRALRRHALRNALLCGAATVALVLLHPLPQPVAILGLATALFALAAWPRHGDL